LAVVQPPNPDVKNSVRKRPGLQGLRRDRLYAAFAKGFRPQAGFGPNVALQAEKTASPKQA
jgi:hypothetical protein